jgi:dihydrofolate reductase
MTEVQDAQLEIVWQKEVKVPPRTTFPVCIDFVVPGVRDDQDVFVYHFRAGAWELVGSGKGRRVTGTFSSFSPVAIVASTATQEAPEGYELALSIPQALDMVQNEEEVFIMGGGSIYEQFLPKADRLYLTRLDKEFEADTYFPYVNFEEWSLVDLEVIDDDPQVDYSYRFEVWERKQ